MFEDWSIGSPDNLVTFQDCTQIIGTDCGQPDICGWNDAPCFLNSSSRGDVLYRPICKQEQTVWDHLYITSE